MCRAQVQGLLLCDDILGLSIAFGLFNATLELFPNPISGTGQVCFPTVSMRTLVHAR